MPWHRNRRDLDVNLDCEAFIVDAVRTPIGRYGGSLATVRADDLAACAIKALMNRTGVTDFRARGFAAGLAAHGIGTARAFQVDEIAGVFSGIAMSLNALVTSFLVPLAVTLLVR